MKPLTLHVWRQVYLAEASVLSGLAIAEATRSGISAPGRAVRVGAQRTVLLGAVLWLMHDLAHGRWRPVIGDSLAVLGGAMSLKLCGCERMVAKNPRTAIRTLASLLGLAGTVYANSFPEIVSAPFIWSRWGRRAGLESGAQPDAS